VHQATKHLNVLKNVGLVAGDLFVKMLVDYAKMVIIVIQVLVVVQMVVQ
jgi:hypothetical protein